MGFFEDYDDTLMNVYAKSIALKVSPCVVRVVVPYKPEEIPKKGHYGCLDSMSNRQGMAFGVSGVIIESEELSDGSYKGYILTVGTPFLRKNGVQRNKIKVDVYLSESKLCKGKLLGCDFHYNLAVVSLRSDTALQTAKLKCLNDTISIKPTIDLPQRSNLFKILPGDRIIVLTRSSYDQSTNIALGVYSLERPEDVPNEYCCVSDIKSKGAIDGGAVINFSGEVIGIILDKSFFLPVNIDGG